MMLGSSQPAAASSSHRMFASAYLATYCAAGVPLLAICSMSAVSISVKTKMETALIEQIAKSGTPAAQYVAKYAEANLLRDEVAANGSLDPSIVHGWQK